MILELPAQPSTLVEVGFMILPLLIAAWLVFYQRQGAHALGQAPATHPLSLLLVGWLLLMGLLSASGWLQDFELPPRALMIFFPLMVAVSYLAFSKYGRPFAMGLSLPTLIAVQGFRFPLELLMAQAAQEGVMPPHMAFSGQNFDILTGIFALLVAGIWQLGVRSQAMVWIWNILGFILLLNVIGLALLSMPTPLQQIFSDPPNIWITFFPFTYLPTVLVAFALFGHLLIFRRLWAERQGNKAGAV